MDVRVNECRPGDDAWDGMAELFSQAVAWTKDPADTGEYHFFAATDGEGRLLGGGVLDVGEMGFGPVADMTIGFLEDIEVLEEHRRKGVGRALLRAVLKFAWGRGARNVRWTVDYDNEAGIALYSSLGAAFVPEEDPDAPEPEKCYTVVAVRPEALADPDAP